MLMRILFLGLTLAISGVARGQNLVINGDLEITTATGCNYNNTNADFTTKMANATAFGAANELDILQVPPCVGTFSFPAQSGSYKVGLHRKSNNDEDAFSLALFSPVSAGQSYTITFHAAQLSVGPAGAVEVGLSNSATSFGTLVASGTPLSAKAWTEFTSSFVAPVDATHLTIRQSNIPNGYSFVDNIQLVQAECFLVVGNWPGNSAFVGAAHSFETQVGPTIEDFYTVLLNDVPEFVLPTPLVSGRSGQLPSVGHGVAGGGAAKQGPPATGASPSWMHDHQFTVQVVMWNPQVFPQLPEQYSAGLFVTIRPNGLVLTEPYGTDMGGLQVWHEIGINAEGQAVIRFPFSIPGQ